MLFPAPAEDEASNSVDSGSSFSSKYSDHEEPGYLKKTVILEESPRSNDEKIEISAEEMNKKIEI